MSPSLNQHAIVRAVAGYLLGHPLAVDSVEGIRRWWMGEEDEVTMEQMRDALNWMQQRSLLEEVRARDGRCLYRRSATDAQLRLLCGDGRGD